MAMNLELSTGQMRKLNSLEEVHNDYDLFLFDAYGVLVVTNGSLPGAAEMLQSLRDKSKEFLVVTNDASKLQETASMSYGSRGLEIEPSRIISSGLVLEQYIRSNKELHRKRLVVIGTDDSREYARRGGAIPVRYDQDFDGIVFADGADENFNVLFEPLFNRYQKYVCEGVLLPLIMANPDMLYPRGGNEFGWAIGAYAKMFNDILKTRFPHHEEFPWVYLGKPYNPIYELALSKFPGKKALFIGDTLETDIAGANAMSLDTLLITTGVSGIPDATKSNLLPTYTMHSW